MRRVWGIGTARTIRVHWMLAELGLEYEARAILPRHASMQDAEFRKLSDRGKVPIYQEGDLAMGESGAITMWLADRYREGPILSPAIADPLRAPYLDLCQYALAELDAPLYTIRLHGGLPEIYGEAPGAIEAARGLFSRMVGEIEARLGDERPHLLGDAFSTADLLVGSCLDWANVVKIPLSEALQAYRTRLAARPAYGQAMRTNFTPEALALLAGKTGAET